MLIGGLRGVHDVGAIHSAIARPYSGYYGPIARKAAALVHSLVLNHGFVDGNKRTALTTFTVLLERSGYTLRGNQEQLNVEAEAMVVAVADHRMDFNELVAWMRERIVRP